MIEKKEMLYIAFKDFSNLHYGANTKVLSQCRAFEEYGYCVSLIGRENANAVLIDTKGNKRIIREFQSINNHHFKGYIAKHSQEKAIVQYTNGQIFDVCYIRYDFSDSKFIWLLKTLKTRCKKIVLELPTYPYEAENSKGVLNRVKINVDKIYRTQLRKYVDYIITFYDGYKELFGIPVIVIPNGFDFSTMSLVESELPTDGIHLIAVSSMREWHGYERMIEGLKAYYKEEKDPENFILHLVGNGRDYGKYKALVEQYHLEPHVIMEGAMHGAELDKLYEKCAIGIDSLARHRSGITVLSSLKSREYGAKGLPMINSCKIDIIEDNFPYLLMVPADESPTDMKAVAMFYHKCFDGVTRQEVGKSIRAYIESKSSMKATLKQVVDVLQS